MLSLGSSQSSLVGTHHEIMINVFLALVICASVLLVVVKHTDIFVVAAVRIPFGGLRVSAGSSCSGVSKPCAAGSEGEKYVIEPFCFPRVTLCAVWTATLLVVLGLFLERPLSAAVSAGRFAFAVAGRAWLGRVGGFEELVVANVRVRAIGVGGSG